MWTNEWNEFMNQLTVDEMTTLIRKNCNMWRSTGLESIAKAANQQKDSYNNNGDTLLWVDAPTITATWNTDLAYEIGQCRGNLSLYNGWSAWGGPEMDTHRSPFSGRNYEYMSQDGLVGGYIAAGLTAGMEAMGVNCYIKHFAFNDQETCRDGMENMVWVSEQAARQIYLKVFQICMQEGGSASSMTGFARFCGIPTSGNNHLTWTYKLLVNDDGVPTPEMDEELEENQVIEVSADQGMGGGGGMEGFDIEPEDVTFETGADITGSWTEADGQITVTWPGNEA